MKKERGEQDMKNSSIIKNAKETKMRKFKLMTIILLVVLVVGLVGCSKKKKNPTGPSIGTQGWPTEAVLTSWKLVGLTQPAGVTEASWYEDVEEDYQESLTINFIGTDATDAAILAYPQAQGGGDGSNGYFLFEEDIDDDEDNIQVLFSTEGGTEEAWYMRDKATGKASLSFYRLIY